MAASMKRKADPKIFDSIDIQVECANLSFQDISNAKPGEPSSVIRERVIKARNIQENRFLDIKGVHCNA